MRPKVPEEPCITGKRELMKAQGSWEHTGTPLSHHHTFYVTSSYILCHIIIHTDEHTGTPLSQGQTYYVTSSYILCHIIIHTMSHHHTHRHTGTPLSQGQTRILGINPVGEGLSAKGAMYLCVCACVYDDVT